MKIRSVLNSRCLVSGIFTAFLCAFITGPGRAQIYVSNLYGDSVGEYGLNGSTINASLVSGVQYPTGIAISGSDLFVVTGTQVGEYNVDSLQANGQATTVNADLLSGLNSPSAVAVSGSNLYVTNAGSAVSDQATDGTIGEYNFGTLQNGHATTVNPSLISGLNSPFGITISGSDLYEANFFNSTVGEYTLSGATVNAALTSRNGGEYYLPDMAVSGSNIYVVDNSHGQILKYTVSGNTATESGALISNLTSPTAIAVSGNDLYITEAGGVNKVAEYTVSGVLVNSSLISNLNAPEGIIVIGNGGNAPPPAVTPQSVVSTVLTGAAYTAATVTPVTSNGGLATTVSLVGGASSGRAVTLGTTNIGSNFTSLASDVVSVSGNAGDVFAVQLTFDLNAANQAGGANAMTLLWLNPSTGQWENAVAGDTMPNTSNPSFLDFQGSFAEFIAKYGAQYNFSSNNLTNVLGAYGVDTTNDTVWGVIDHNSDFAVANPDVLPEAAPEPSTWALLAAATSLLLVFRRGNPSAKVVTLLEK